MGSIIYQATDLKDRRTELLSAAAAGGALVRAVDGTALVFTRLDHVETDRFVAGWSLALHQAGEGRSDVRLGWLQSFDADDRAECLRDLWEAIEAVAGGTETNDAFDSVLAEWRATARALRDSDHRDVLLGDVSTNDFVPAERPQ